MTPKEQANDLIDGMFITIEMGMEDCSFTYRPDEFIIYKRRTAINCALITVEKILKADPLSPAPLTGKPTSVETYKEWEYKAYNYWKEVKKHLVETN